MKKLTNKKLKELTADNFITIEVNGEELTTRSMQRSLITMIEREVDHVAVGESNTGTTWNLYKWGGYYFLDKTGRACRINNAPVNNLLYYYLFEAKQPKALVHYITTLENENNAKNAIPVFISLHFYF